MARQSFRLLLLAGVLLAAAVALSTAAPVAPAQGGAVRECGDVDVGVGIKNLTTRRVSCRRARRIARTHPRDSTPLGFRCRERTLQQYEYDIRCTKGGRVVRWQYVSD